MTSLTPTFMPAALAACALSAFMCAGCSLRRTPVSPVTAADAHAATRHHPDARAAAAPDAETVPRVSAFRSLGPAAVLGELVAELTRTRSNPPNGDPACLFANPAAPEGPRFTGHVAFDSPLPEPLDRFDFDPSREVPVVWTPLGTAPTGASAVGGRVVVLTETPYDAFNSSIALVFFSPEDIIVRAPSHSERTRRFAPSANPTAWASVVAAAEVRTVLLIATRPVPLTTLSNAWNALRGSARVVALAAPVAPGDTPTVVQDTAGVLGCPSPPPSPRGGSISEAVAAQMLANLRPSMEACIHNRYAQRPRSLQMVGVTERGTVDMVCSLGGAYAPREVVCLQHVLETSAWPPIGQSAITDLRIEAGALWTSGRDCPP